MMQTRAFRKHDRVARLTLEICRKDWDRDYPSPYCLSKIIRFFADQSYICWADTKKIISDFGNCLRKLFRGPRRTMCDDVEIGNANQLPADNDLNCQPPEREKRLYGESLKKTFGNSPLSKELMDRIDSWENNTYGYSLY